MANRCESIPLEHPTTFQAAGLDVEPGLPLRSRDSHDDLITSWHPKWTGARLFAISTTIGLGTAKAAMPYCGDVIPPVTIDFTQPTTMEWLSGVLLSVS
jgi:hypothetical protein